MSEPGAAGAGMKRVWGWVKRKWVWIVLACISLTCFGLVILFWHELAEFARTTQDPNSPSKDSNLDILRGFGLLVAGAAGIIFTYLRSHYLNRQTKVSEQGLITDRFIKATEQLGSETESVRIGAVYSLWRIAVDTPAQSDKIAVLDMLCAFVRSSGKQEKSNKGTDTKADPEERFGQDVSKDSAKDKKMEPIREDIHIAVKLLAKRIGELCLKKDANNGKEYRLDLQGAWLNGADLGEANLVEANLEGANLGGANLGGAKLVGGGLWRARLVEADLEEANLERVDLGGANLECANLVEANLKEANLVGAYLVEANIEGARLWGAKLGRANLEEASLWGADLAVTNLWNARLVGAYLENTDFKDAKLTKTRFTSRKDLANALNVGDLSEAIFEDERPSTKPTPPDAEET